MEKMNRREKTYIKSFFAMIIILLILGIVSFVYSIVEIFNTQTLNNNIFELIYMGLHLIIVVFILMMTKSSLNKEESVVFKPLMMQKGDRFSNRKAQVIALILGIGGLFCAIYFFLVQIGVSLPKPNFPITLILDLVNSPLTVAILGFYSFFYPYVLLKKDN